MRFSSVSEAAMHRFCPAVSPASPGTSSVRRVGLLALLSALVALATVAGAWAQKAIAPAVKAPAAVRSAADLAAEQALALDHKIVAESKNGSELMKNLTYLSDLIGPRLTGSAALKRGNEWTAAKMRSYGLSNVHLEPWTIPAAWERGPATARIVEPDNGRTLLVAAMGWTPGTNGKVTGEVVIVNGSNAKQLAAYKGKLRIAIVLQGPPRPVRPITEKGGPQLWSNLPIRMPRREPAAATPPGKAPAGTNGAAPRRSQDSFAWFRDWMAFRK